MIVSVVRSWKPSSTILRREKKSFEGTTSMKFPLPVTLTRALVLLSVPNSYWPTQSLIYSECLILWFHPWLGAPSTLPCPYNLLISLLSSLLH
jgi:hypothetical protein